MTKSKYPEWKVKLTQDVLDSMGIQNPYGDHRQDTRKWSEILTSVENQVKDNHEKNEAKKVYRPVAGRRKLPEGKKARHSKKGATEFEMELVHYLEAYYEGEAHVFRSPSSKSPVDVWCLTPAYGAYRTNVACYQCKTTLDTKPSRIDQKEMAEFIKLVKKINARAFWVDRWKLNKNVYVRRIRAVNLLNGELYAPEEFNPVSRDESHT